MKQLKPQDAQFLFMEDANIASHIASILICDQSSVPGGKVRFKQILRTIEERLSSSPLYDSKLKRMPLDIDLPYWVQDEYFDLEYHVRHARLPEPADWRQLCIQIARIHSRPLDMSRPLWEIHIVEGLDNVEGVAPDSFAVIIKVHHAIVDGTSAMQFIFSMLDLGAEGPPIVPLTGRRRIENPQPVSPTFKAMRAVANNVSAPMKISRSLLGLTPKLAKVASQRITGKKPVDAKVPMTRFNSDVSPNRAFDAVLADMKDLKAIRKLVDDATINDVVLAVIGGGLRKYLQSKNELPELPLIITAPINSRQDGGEAGGNDGNDITAMSVPLFSNLRDPVERLKAIAKASKSAKAANSGLQSRILTDAAQTVPSLAMSTLTPFMITANTNSPVANAVVSNVRGPDFPIYFCGAKIDRLFGMAPIAPGMGLFIATPSYLGKMSFSVTTTRQIIPDLPFFMKCITDAIEGLLEAASVKQDRVEVAQKRAASKSFIRLSEFDAVDEAGEKAIPAPSNRKKAAPAKRATKRSTAPRKPAASKKATAQTASRTAAASAAPQESVSEAATRRATNSTNAAPKKSTRSRAATRKTTTAKTTRSASATKASTAARSATTTKAKSKTTKPKTTAKATTSKTSSARTSAAKTPVKKAVASAANAAEAKPKKTTPRKPATKKRSTASTTKKNTTGGQAA